MHQQAILTSLARQCSLSVHDSKIVIVGLGVTGLSVARFLYRLQFTIIVWDTRINPPLQACLLDECPGVSLLTGEKVFDRAGVTHFSVSPGIPMNAYFVRSLFVIGALHVSDIDLFATVVDEPIVAITGSNGKSTVTRLLAEMALAAGKKVAVGGNLGPAALDLLANGIELYILELSSFQLERTTLLNATLATVLNISADHLDRYENRDAYKAAKQRVFQGDGMMILNADDTEVMAMQLTHRESITFALQQSAHYEVSKGYLSIQGRPVLALDAMLLQGVHNQANALAALALGEMLLLPSIAMLHALRHFKGLAHRMQCIADINGVQWINDSKATNIGACLAALEGFIDRQVILIAGGDAKGAEMHELLPMMKKVKKLLLIGKDAHNIEQAVSGVVESIHVYSLEKAVLQASEYSEPGDVVLLSPACASLDQFTNYQHRGDVFKTAVEALPS